MAIAFARISYHSRSQGHSAVAGAAYRSGLALYDQRTGEQHDYQNRQDVVFSEVMLPEGANEKFYDRETLWNAVELKETRKNSQIAKDLILALPRELSREQQIELAKSFAKQYFVDQGIVVDVAIHDHAKENPHAHLYMTTRRLQGEQFLDKVRDLEPDVAKGRVVSPQYWGEKWRTFQNEFFQAHGIDCEVDENYLIAQHHTGRIRGAVSYLKGINDVRKQLSHEIAIRRPAKVLAALGEKYAVFTEKDVRRLLKKNIAVTDPQAIEIAFQKVMRHHDLVALGTGEDGRPRYTTCAQYRLEAKLAEDAKAMAFRKAQPAASQRVLNRLIEQYGLNEEQANALHYLGRNRGLTAIVGRAGTGKSYMMRAAREMWEAQGLKVVGNALSGVAAKGLASGSEIETKTIAYYQLLIKNNAWPLDENTVVVMDEAGMTDSVAMAEIISHVKQCRAQLVLVGDHAQLQPVGLGAIFRAIVEMVGFAEMNQIMRQVDPKDCEATRQLAAGNINAAIDHYVSKQAVHLYQDADQATTHLINDWYIGLSKAALQKQIILAHNNLDVARLNLAARERLIENDQLQGVGSTVQSEAGKISLLSGERLLLLKNNKKLGVCNGDFATLLNIQGDKLTVKLDSDSKLVTFAAAEYGNFQYGYATTVHKSQGATLDNVFVYTSGRWWNRYLTYVALSRHREQVSLYACGSQFKNLDDLKKALSREAVKDNVIDYAISYAIRRGFNPDGVAGRFIDRVMGIGAQIKNRYLFVTNYEAFLTLNAHQEKTQADQVRREQAKTVAAFIDAHRALRGQYQGFEVAFAKASQSHAKKREMLAGYEKWLDATYEKQRLAFEIWQQPKDYERALELNHINLATIEKAASAYALEKRVRAYVHAYEAGKIIAMQQAARDILQSGSKDDFEKAYYGRFAKVCQAKQLDVNTLLQSVKQSGLADQYFQTKQRLSDPLAGERLKTVYAYAKTEQDLREKWRLYKQYDIQAAAQIDQRERLGQQLDEMGAKLYRDLPLYQTGIDALQVDINELKQRYDRHIHRQTVIDYQKAPTMEERRQLASEILVDRSYDRYVFEQKADWQQLITDKKAQENFVLLKTLTNRDERLAYQLVKQYQQARIDTGRAFEVYYQHRDADLAVAEAQKQLAVNILQVRNRLAAEIHQNHAGCVPFFEKLRVNTLDLMKHANDYKTHLHQQKIAKEKAKRLATKKPILAKSKQVNEFKPMQVSENKPEQPVENKTENKAVNHDLKNLEAAFKPDEIKLLTHPDWQLVSEMKASPFVDRLKLLDEVRVLVIKKTKEDAEKAKWLYQGMRDDLKKIVTQGYYKELFAEKMPALSQFMQQHGKSLGFNIGKGKDISM